MAFAKIKKFSPAEAKQYVGPFMQWIEDNADLVRTGEDGDGWDYMFVMKAEIWDGLAQEVFHIYPNMFVSPEIQRKAGIQRARIFMLQAKYLEFIYVDYPANTLVAIFLRDSGERGITIPTMLKGNVRMPQLSHLITLTPQDFFTVIKLIYYCKPQTADKIKLDLASAGLNTEILETNSGAGIQLINHFFRRLKTNYVLNQDVAMKQWMRIADLEEIVLLEPTIENQMYALQYITALSHDDISFIPTETAIELELDWTVTANEDYAIRPVR